MSPLKKGPDIKFSELKMPRFLTDLYYDLQDRNLLPVVVLLVAGIIAVPFLLGDSEADESLVPPPATAGAPAKTSSVIVTKEAASLRDYKRRLNHLQKKDPFQAPPSAQSQESDEGSSGGGGGQQEVFAGGGEESGDATAPVEDETAPSGGSSPDGDSGSSDFDSGETQLHYFTYSIDVRVVPVSIDGKPNKAEPTVRRDLAPLTMLPSRTVPALTYMGPSRDGKKAMMLVSSNVTSLFGDSTCAVGSDACQLLALEPNLPQTVVFGANRRTYRIELLAIEIEVTDHLKRAPLGKPKPGKDQGK